MYYVKTCSSSMFSLSLYLQVIFTEAWFIAFTALKNNGNSNGIQLASVPPGDAVCPQWIHPKHTALWSTRGVQWAKRIGQIRNMSTIARVLPRSRFVSRNGPKWLVAITSSRPSLVFSNSTDTTKAIAEKCEACPHITYITDQYN